MTMFSRLFQAEFLKIRKTKIYQLLLLSPILCSFVAFGGGFQGASENEWLDSYYGMVFTHGTLFLPMITGIFASYLCRYEHLDGGWKQMLTLPIPRTYLYFAKFSMIMGLIAIMQLLMIPGLFLAGTIKGMSDPFPLTVVLISLTGGWIATFPLVALQLWVSTAWKSFAAPMAINVILTFPSILAANSEKYGPFYPWAQPFLGMIPLEGPDSMFFFSVQTLIFVICGSFLLFFLGGLRMFMRRIY
ncbi:ABC transporter permease [Bacillus sp. AK128]